MNKNIQYEKRVMRLSDLHPGRQINLITNVVEPGSHCPLFGVGIVTPQIVDMAVLTVGTSECCWYALSKQLMLERNLSTKSYSYTMERTDISFGCVEAVKNAVQEIYTREKPSSVAIVSSCIPEIIGDRYEDLVQELNLPIPIFSVRTSHYNSSGHYAGIEAFLTSWFPAIQKAKTNPMQVNLLGVRNDNFIDGELCRILQGKGYELLNPCCTADIRKLGQGVANIVADITAWKLAKQMEDAYGIPFVLANQISDPEDVEAMYCRLEQILGVTFHERYEARDQSRALVACLSKELSGKTFAAAPAFLMALDLSDFLCRMGMIPKVILCHEFFETEKRHAAEIARYGFDPYITTFANMIAAEEWIAYGLRPDYLVGQSFNPIVISNKSISYVDTRLGAGLNGFDLPIFLLKKLKEGCKNGAV